VLGAEAREEEWVSLPPNLGEKLSVTHSPHRAFAEARSIPISHVPDRAGVSRTHFWDVMAGRESPKVEWLAKVGYALGVDAGDLLAPARPSRP
jgi:hypothetical protein